MLKSLVLKAAVIKLFNMKKNYLYSFYILLLTLSGYMTFHDSEISKFNEVIGVFSGQDRIYKNKPSYFSENSAYFGLKLSGYLTNDHSEKIDSVRFTINAAKEILVSYYDKNPILIYTKELGEKIEFKNGKITLDHFSSCASRDTPCVGCEWSSVTLSENKDGDLSAVKNGGALA